MKRPSVLRLFFLLSACLSLRSQASAQQTLIGLNTSDDVTFSNLTTTGYELLGIGVAAEHEFDAHNGIETGFYYQRYAYEVGGNLAYHFLTVPVLYKFSSHILNVSAGPTVTRYLGSATTAYFEPSLATAPAYNTFGFGYMVKLSKSFTAGKLLVIEPEFRFARSFTYQASGGGVGLALKYRVSR